MPRLFGFHGPAELLYRVCRRYVNLFNGENNANIYKNGELRFLKDALPECKVVFDVGANTGEWASLSMDINPEIELHCFEPSEKTYQKLQQRGLLKDRVRLNHFGLGAASGEHTLHIFSEAAGTNSIYKRQGLSIKQTTTERINLVTLDEYCQKNNVARIDLLKLDVEGHELDVLKGGSDMLSQKAIQRIQFEYGGTYIDARILLKDMFELLSSYGFRLYKVYPKHLKLVECYDQSLENFQYQNWVAVMRQ